MIACDLIPWHLDEPWFTISAVVVGVVMAAVLFGIGLRSRP